MVALNRQMLRARDLQRERHQGIAELQQRRRPSYETINLSGYRRRQY
jgi:hypothetical protein